MRDIRALTVIAPVLFLLGSAAGCSGPTEPAATSPATPARAGGAAKATAATPAVGTEAAARTGRKAAACRAADLATTITLQPDGAGPTRRALVTLANNGERACTLDGWLSVAPVNAAAETVTVPTRKVDQPGPPQAFTVAPGTSAFAGIAWTVCADDDPDCDWSNSLRYSLTGASADGPYATLEDFPDPERHQIRMKSLRIGTLQPSRQGVVAW